MNDNKDLSNRAITGGQAERIGLAGWLSLYVSGAVIFFLLLIHILAIHFFADEKITVISVRADFKSLSLTIINLGLLFFGLFHGLLGLRRVVLDLEIFGKKGDQIFIWVLTAGGFGLAVFGIAIFQGFTAF